MNTEQTEQTLAFGEAEANAKPTLICVGQVGSVEDSKVSASENYIVQPIKIEALDAGRNQTVYFLYRPEWLTKDFKPHNLKKTSKGAHFVYSKNIASKDSLSALRGLAGSTAAFGKISTALLSLPIAPGTAGPSMEDVTDVLRDFFADNRDSEGKPRLVGYELRQQATATGEFEEVDGKRKQIYQKENRYNINSFWDVTTENITRMIKRAYKSPVDPDTNKKKVIMTYGEVPF